MGILEKNIVKIDKKLLPTIQGFLSELQFKDNQILVINEREYKCFRTYVLTFKYFYKTKVLRIEFKDAFIQSQIEIELFIKKVGYCSKFDFLNHYTNKMITGSSFAVFEINMIAFKKFNEYLFDFEQDY